LPPPDGRRAQGPLRRLADLGGAGRLSGDPPAGPHPGHHRHQRPPRLRRRHLPAPTSATDRGYARYSRHSAPGPRPARTDSPDPGDPGRPSDLYPALQPAAGLLSQPGRGLVSAAVRAPGPGRGPVPALSDPDPGDSEPGGAGLGPDDRPDGRPLPEPRLR